MKVTAAVETNSGEIRHLEESAADYETAVGALKDRLGEGERLLNIRADRNI